MSRTPGSGGSRGAGRAVRAPRTLGLVAGSIVLAALLFLFVLPSRTYLAQRHSLAASQMRLRVFQDENAKLAASVDRLQTDAEIERIARQQFGLVKPGEKAFVIVPPPKASGLGRGAAAAKKAARPGIVSRVWHDIQFWN